MLTIEINGMELSKDNHYKVKFNTNTGLKMRFKKKKKEERMTKKKKMNVVFADIYFESGMFNEFKNMYEAIF